MTRDAAPDLADRFARIIAALCDAVARRVGPGILGALAGPLIILIRARLWRLKTRFTRLATHPAKPAPSARIAAPRPVGVPRKHGADPLPALRRFASLLRLVPETAPLASQLRHLLADPEMKALLEAAPELSRALRPLCRMLGIRPALPPPRLGAAPRAILPHPAAHPQAIPPPWSNQPWPNPSWPNQPLGLAPQPA